MDYPYLVFFFVLILLSYLYWRCKDKKFANWAFVISFVFFAFRAPVVGADTWDYIRYLTGERNFYNYDSRPLEPLFVIYRDVLCLFTSSRFLVMVINTIISLAPLYYMTKKYSVNPPLSILLFCYLDGMLIYFVALRQIIALSILYMALIYWLKEEKHYYRKMTVFFFSIVVSYLFHTSSVLFALLIIIAIIPFKISKMACAILIIGSAMFGIVLEKFNVLDAFSIILSFEFSSIERLDNYMENDELKDVHQLHLLLRLTVFALIPFLCMRKDRVSHPFSKLFLMSVIINNFFYSIPMIGRITGPLMFYGAIIFTWIMCEKYNRRYVYRRYINVIVFIVVLYFTRTKIIWLSEWDKNDEARMHPYYFIFEDYKDHPSIKNFGTTG